MQKLITIKTDKTQVASPLGEFKFEVDLREEFTDIKEKGVQVLSMRTQENFGKLKTLVGITSDELIEYLKSHPEQLLILEDPVEATPEGATAPEAEETKQEDKSSE